MSPMSTSASSSCGSSSLASASSSLDSTGALPDPPPTIKHYSLPSNEIGRISQDEEEDLPEMVESLEEPAAMSSCNFLPSNDLMRVSSLSCSASIPTLLKTPFTSSAAREII